MSSLSDTATDLRYASGLADTVQQCSRCVLDANDDPAITFDANGVCNHCAEYDRVERQHVLRGAEAEQRLAAAIADIKEAGKGKRYDCVLGLSGGVDSTYLAYLAVQHGLRPLAVHLDNGWNSEIAVRNIANVVNRLGLDLETLVLDWEEFRDLQLAYLRGSVIDIEVLTDHAIYGTVYRLAAKNKLRFVLSGMNVVTEAMLPPHWIFNKGDATNILSIHAAYGTRSLRTFPLLDTRAKKYFFNVLGIQSVSLLNWVPYVKSEIKRLITKELGWQDYGMKHGESVFTRFYQSYILPIKFGVDKRKAHLSNLICSGQITRADALRELEEPICDPGLLATDKDFVLKKLELSNEEFDALMRTPPRPHTDFATERSLYDRFPFLRMMKPVFDRLKHKAVR
jgi:N-acetyl sugar amidotransferase